MERRTRVVVLDRSPIVHEGVKTAIEATDDLSYVGAFRTAEDALAAMESLLPDVAVVDQRLLGMNGLTACRAIASKRPQTRVVMFVATFDESVLHAALVAGARGFITKSEDTAELIGAIRSVARDEAALTRDGVAALVRWASKSRNVIGPRALAPHELSVLSLAAQGNTNSEIAQALHVSEGSVKLYVRSLIRKLDVNERSQAVALGLRRGLI